MKIHWSKFFNFLILLVVLVILAGFQSTFWFQLFGTVPAPMLWLCLVVYVALYRKLYPSLFMLYVMSLALTGFTALPLKILFINLLVVYLILYSIRSRVFWEGAGYYTIMCTLSSFAYHVISLLSSWLVERNSAPLVILDRVVQLVLTPVFAVPMFWLLLKIDKLTLEENSPESGGLEL